MRATCLPRSTRPPDPLVVFAADALRKSWVNHFFYLSGSLMGEDSHK